MKNKILPELVHVGDDCLWFAIVVRVHSTYSDQTCDVITESGDFIPDIPQEELEAMTDEPIRRPGYLQCVGHHHGL